MTTIAQLPVATTVAAADLLPLSQAGVLHAASVAQLTAALQPLIDVPTGALLGRVSTGAGGPESVAVGVGLAVDAGALVANGGDHAGFPVARAMSLSADLVISENAAPGLLAVTALRGLFEAGAGIAIDANGVVSTTVSAIAGPAGPTGVAGPVGAVGATGPAGPAGPGLGGPTAASSASTVGAADYVALWQNGALAWMPYGQFIGGQTIDELASAGPAADSDELLVAQGGNALSSQSFGALWSYVQTKLPSVQQGVVELTGNTVLDSTQHNDRILVASQPLTLTANFNNTGAGFACTLINLAAGDVTFGTGISSGSGGTILPPGGSTSLVGVSYSGGSLIWWSGIVPNAPTLTVGAIVTPAPQTAFNVVGGVFNDAPTALDYSTDGGATWVAAASPVITANAYSFTIAGLAPGTYTVRVRDHADVAVIGVSNSFTIAQPSISLNAVAATIALGAGLSLSGGVAPGNVAVQVGLSTSATVAPASWVNAVVANESWSAALTPVTAGTYYVWAEQTASPAVAAVSAGLSVVAASITIDAPTSGTAGSALSLSGTVSPVGDAVTVQLATQNLTVPTSGWTPASNVAGSFTASLTPAQGGTYYAWVQDAASGLTAVSAAITVTAAAGVTYGINNPGGTFAHGVGTIGLNGTVTPAQVIGTQVAMSTSASMVPTSGWQPASVIYGNAVWAVYYATPATPGSYYVWVETTAGTDAVVSSFSVTVT
jgi:hypothetical protein